MVKVSNDNNDIRLEGYLIRFSDFNDNQDRDIQGERFGKSTYFMQEAGFPIKGAPIKFQHSLDNDFGMIGIGILDFVNEDDIGIFVKGQLYKAEQYKQIIEAIAKKRGMSLSKDEIDLRAKNAYKAVKSLVQNVPLKFSMGAYPPTYKVDKVTKTVLTAGIVEATLTPSPVEPFGTDVDFYVKSLLEVFPKEQIAERDDEQPKNNNKGDIKLLKEKLAQIVANFVDELMSQLEEPITEEVGEVKAKELDGVKSVINMSVMEQAKKDTGVGKAIKAEDEGALVESVKSILDANVGDYVSRAIQNVLSERAKTGQNLRNSVRSAVQSHNSNIPDVSKSEAVETSENNMKAVRITVGDTIRPIGEMMRDLAMGKTFNEDYTHGMKAMNPNAGTLGGFLVGTQTAQTILDPLRPEVVAFNAGVVETRIDGIGVYTVPKMTTAPQAYRPGINTSIPDSEAGYDSISAYLRPLAVKVNIPRQMLMATGTNAEEQIQRQLRKSLRLQIDKECFIGVGAVEGAINTSKSIMGIRAVLDNVGLSAHNVTLATNGRKPKYDDLINAETTIASANVDLEGSSTAFVMHPRDRGTFRRTVDTTGQPLLYPSYADKPYEDLIGYRALTTTQIPNNETVGTANNASTIFFGNFAYAEYVLGSDIELIVDDMTRADSLQVRFIAYLYSDFIVHYPEAFYVMRGVTP